MVYLIGGLLLCAISVSGMVICADMRYKNRTIARQQHYINHLENAVKQYQYYYIQRPKPHINDYIKTMKWN